ncbi:hypothetical protein UFOVP1406_4 [uncultured Caudovirales phage]|uniref:Uncharacterized protein n=1 Tax=uncultured Caudovirales phage TaxID=2100421 RepID=A0A6J5S816_9CAUD|nr:hypothetical protein UFOVP1406_4 [uncultured Caudovirales phage]
MASVITASQLRSVLGVSSSLYSDAYLEQIIDTGEAVILPMLVANASAITAYELKSNIAYFYCQRVHNFVAGESVVVAGLPSPFSATFTVVDIGDIYFTAALTNADVTRRAIIPNGTATLSGYGAATLYAATPAIESAMYAVCVEIFQSRVAAGGQIEGVDFASSPYRMGRSLTNRVSALLQPYLDVETIVQ